MTDLDGNRKIKAIQTTYNGYKFRSRLEARWAVLFDTLKVEWEYEKEGYELGELGWYLPDFWLPDLDAWVEIKGTPPTDVEIEKLCRTAWGTKSRGWVFWGSTSPGSGNTAFYIDANIPRWKVTMGKGIETYGHPTSMAWPITLEDHGISGPQYGQASDAFKSARFGKGGRG